MSRKCFTPPQPSPNLRGESKKFTNDARIAILPLPRLSPRTSDYKVKEDLSADYN